MKKNTKKLVYSAVLAALAVVLTAFKFPIFIAAPFLECDFADVPLLIGAIFLGPWYALAIAAVSCTVQGLTFSAASGFLGILMHFIASGSFVLCVGMITRYKKTILRVLQALLCGSITRILVMIPLNLIFTPIFLEPTADFILNLKTVLKALFIVPNDYSAFILLIILVDVFVLAFALSMVYSVDKTIADGADIDAKNNKLKALCTAAVVGLLYGALSICVLNLLISDIQLTPGAMQVKAVLLTLIVPFNAIVAVLNSVLATGIYAALKRHIRL